MRGIERTFDVACQTVTSWIKKVQKLPELKESLVPSKPDDILELDELWSFVGTKKISNGSGLLFAEELDRLLLLLLVIVEKRVVESFGIKFHYPTSIAILIVIFGMNL